MTNTPTTATYLASRELAEYLRGLGFTVTIDTATPANRVIITNPDLTDPYTITLDAGTDRVRPGM